MCTCMCSASACACARAARACARACRAVISPIILTMPGSHLVHVLVVPEGAEHVVQAAARLVDARPARALRMASVGAACVSEMRRYVSKVKSAPNVRGP